MLCTRSAWAQTVRHHKEAVEDPNQPPELHQAEAALEQRDYTKAEPLLQKVVQANPKNYVAWFDLGFTYNAMGRVDDSIHAYQQSVDAKPDVFESNLNLGSVSCIIAAHAICPGSGRGTASPARRMNPSWFPCR